MADRKRYVVTIGGLKHTMLLDADDAKAYGSRAVAVKEAVAPANKARQPRNKSTK